MKLNYVYDPRIADDAAYRVISHPQDDGYFAVIDNDFMEILFTGYDLDEAVEFACEKNRKWQSFMDDLLG